MLEDCKDNSFSSAKETSTNRASNSKLEISSYSISSSFSISTSEKKSELTIEIQSELCFDPSWESKILSRKKSSEMSDVSV